MVTGAASSNDKATSLLKDKGKRPVEYQMCTPPQGPRACLSPMPLTEPPGLGGLPLPGGRPASGEATADKDRFMTLCGARLTKLYKELEQDYDRVHSTSKGDDQRETAHEELEAGLDSGLDEVRSTGSLDRSALSNKWEMESHSSWITKRKEDSTHEGRAVQPKEELTAHVPCKRIAGQLTC